MDLKIRKATLKDAQHIALLGRITFKEAFSHIWEKQTLKNYLTETFSVAKLKSSLQKPNNVFWIVFADDLPIGYAKLKKYSPSVHVADATPSQLQKIYILNDFVGNGIGERLQNKLFQEVEKNDTKTLWLGVWAGNHKAVNFYKNHGFSIAADYQYSFENMTFDFHVMTKTFAK